MSAVRSNTRTSGLGQRPAPGAPASGRGGASGSPDAARPPGPPPASRRPGARPSRWSSRAHGTSPARRGSPGPSRSPGQAPAAGTSTVRSNRPPDRATTARWPSPVVVRSSAPGQAPGDLLSVRVRHVRIVPVVHDQRRGAHASRQRGDVQLLPTDLEPVLEIPAHRVVGPQRQTQDACAKAWENSTTSAGGARRTARSGSETVAHGERHCRAAERVADQSVHRPHGRGDRAQRTGELRQGSLTPVRGAVGRRIEEDHAEAALHQRTGERAESPGPAAPAMSQYHDRPLAPLPHGDVLLLASNRPPSPGRQK